MELIAAKGSGNIYDFNDILAKENNFLRISRSPIFDFETVESHLLTFSKTSIESWNYSQLIGDLFEQKLLLAKSSSDKSALKAMRDDIFNILASCYALDASYLPYEISLSTVTGVPCTKLHADFLPLRLVCTYQGPGTVFLPRESTRYPCLNEGRENRRVLIKGKPSFQAEPFELLLLKGRKFNKGELKPCAHRSPEVEKGQKRLVLKIDFR